MRTWQAITRTAHTPVRLLHSVPAAPLAVERDSASHLVLEPKLSVFMHEMSRQAVLAWRWLERKRTQQLAARRIHVSDTVSLGEKRFVSIVQVDGAQFLIGGSQGSISLLAKLNEEETTSVAKWAGSGVAEEKG